jgi:predicted ATPase
MTSPLGRTPALDLAALRSPPPPPYLTRVKLTNYRSIASCDVRLSALTFLVGPNGAGKSNFLDALAFVRDSLRTSLEYAIRERSGIDAVRRRSNGHPHNFGVRLEFRLPGGETGHYAFQVGAAGRGGYQVIREECVIDADAKRHSYAVKNGVLAESTLALAPAAYPDRLFLTNASGVYPFRALFDAFGSMGFYNLNPRLIRDLQTPADGSLLAMAGENITSVLALMSVQAPQRKEQVEELLTMIVPGISGVESVQVGPKETLEFRQTIDGAKNPWRFAAANMSDGTLRALGILVALFQPGGSGRIPLVGIEEPEVALHPAAAGVLMGALRKASINRQVLITSHSPDLLDDPGLNEQEILGVAAKGNVTYISAPDQAAREVIRSGLYTPGELLRLDQIAPSVDLYGRGPRQLDLFTGWRA